MENYLPMWKKKEMELVVRHQVVDSPIYASIIAVVEVVVRWDAKVYQVSSNICNTIHTRGKSFLESWGITFLLD